MFATHRDEKIALLARVPMFADLSKRQLKDVAKLLDVTDVPAGRELTREGERGLEFFLVVEGLAHVLRDGREVATLTTGDVVGELAIVTDARRSATVVTHTAMRVLVGERRTLQPLLDSDPQIRDAVLGAADLRAQLNAA